MTDIVTEPKAESLQEKKLGWVFEKIKKAKLWLIIIWTTTMPVIGWCSHTMYVGWQLDKRITAIDARVSSLDAHGTTYSDSNMALIKTDIAVLKAQVQDLHDWLKPTHVAMADKDKK
jgi:hypothetical protein